MGYEHSVQDRRTTICWLGVCDIRLIVRLNLLYLRCVYKEALKIVILIFAGFSHWYGAVDASKSVVDESLTS